MNAPLRRVRPAFPDKLQCLFWDRMPDAETFAAFKATPGVQINGEPGGALRYIILHSGRGGTKSWSVARALLIRGAQTKKRILCARELMNTIDESVHFLLSMQIGQLGMSGMWETPAKRIYNRLGSEFIFKGLRHNIDEIKSLEDVDIVWIEEAKNVTNVSWNVLIPTIRKPGSQIIITFNPDLEGDVTYKRFVLSPPTNSIVVKTGYEDNDWMSDDFKQEMADTRKRSEDEFLNVYGGFPKLVLDGAVYANELRAMRSDNRLTRVPYDHSKPVSTFWDLGRSDMTAIWFIQRVGFDWRVLHYFQDCGHHIEHYLKYLQSRDYVYGTHWLPHDAEAQHLGSRKTIKRQVQDVYGADHVKTVRRASIANGINAARMTFPNCWFDQESCIDGLQCLTHYQYKIDEETKQRSKEPLHNEYSHGADAFRYFAVSVKEGAEGEHLKTPPARHRSLARPGLGWMSQ